MREVEGIEFDISQNKVRINYQTEQELKKQQILLNNIPTTYEENDVFNLFYDCPYYNNVFLIIEVIFF